MSDDSPEWSARRRVLWRVQFAGGVLAIAAVLLTGSYYLWSRASVDDVKKLDEKKADKTEIQRLDGRVDSLGALTGNVRDNLIILMSKQGAKPVSLPPAVEPMVKPLAPGVQP